MFSGLSAATGNHIQLFELQHKYCTRQISRGTAKAEVCENEDSSEVGCDLCWNSKYDALIALACMEWRSRK